MYNLFSRAMCSTWFGNELYWYLRASIESCLSLYLFINLSKVFFFFFYSFPDWEMIYICFWCRKSSRINTTLAVNGLTPLLISRLDHQDAIARLNLLKLIKVAIEWFRVVYMLSWCRNCILSIVYYILSPICICINWKWFLDRKRLRPIFPSTIMLKYLEIAVSFYSTALSVVLLCSCYPPWVYAISRDEASFVISFNWTFLVIFIYQ